MVNFQGGHSSHPEVRTDAHGRGDYPYSLWHHPAPQTDTTINLGDEGLNQGDTIDSYFDQYLGEGVELVIPSGEYQWEMGGLAPYPNCHIRGEGGLGGVILDREGATGEVDLWLSGGVMVIENIDVYGQTPADTGGFNVRVEDPGGELIFKRFRIVHGLEPDPLEQANGVYMDSYRPEDDSKYDGHYGTLRFLWSMVTRYGDNGLYCDGPIMDPDALGQVIVVGGHYRLNNISNIRIGHYGHTVYGATIEATGDRENLAYHDYDDGYNNQRGVRIRQPAAYDNYDFLEESNNLVDQCEFHYPEGAGGSGLFVIAGGTDPDKTTGRLLRSRFQNESDVPAIRDAHEDVSVDGQWQAWDCHLRGSGDTSSDLTLRGSSMVGSGANQVDTDSSGNPVPWWGGDIDGGGGDPDPEPEPEPEPSGPTFDTAVRNGVPGIQFRRDGVYETGIYDQPLQPPYAYVAVGAYNRGQGIPSPPDDHDYLIHGYPDQPGHMVLDMNRDGNVALWAGNNNLTLPADNEPHIFVVQVDGANSVLRRDDERVTGDAGSNAQYGTILGGNDGGDRLYRGWLGHFEVFNRKLPQVEEDRIVSALRDKFNL